MTDSVPAQDTIELSRVIAEFQRRLPDWWWSIGACSISRDASCGPDRLGRDADLLAIKDFDEGFHHDGEGTVVESLRIVMEYALERRALARKEMPRAEDAVHAVLLAENERLRAALAPFIAYARNVDDNGWMDNGHRERIGSWFGPSDFRKAAIAAGEPYGPEAKERE